MLHCSFEFGHICNFDFCFLQLFINELSKYNLFSAWGFGMFELIIIILKKMFIFDK